METASGAVAAHVLQTFPNLDSTMKKQHSTSAPWRLGWIVTWLTLGVAAPASGQMVSAGQFSSFAITRSGASFAWGSDVYGELGMGREAMRASPYQITGRKFVSVAPGTDHILALQSDGTVLAWGRNVSGQLGNGTTVDSGVPVAMEGQFQSIFTASHSSFGIRRDGTLWAWGSNADGQLGDGTLTNRPRPVLIGSGFSAVSGGYSCVFGVKADGSLWRWGRCDDTPGVMSQPTRTLIPVQVGTNYASIAANESHVVAIKRDGSLWSWGRNYDGELGDGTNIRQPVATQVGTGFSAAAVGFYFTVALKTDGSLWSWGANLRGTLGRRTAASSEDPKPGLIGNGFATIRAGFHHIVALKTDGTVWAWGYNNNGQIGDGSTQTAILPIQVAAGFSMVEAGYDFSAAIDASQALWLWGSNDSGQLLSTLPTRSVIPKRMVMDFVLIESSKDTYPFEFHAQSFGIRADGSLWAWGDNQFGQLGDGTTVARSAPVQVATGVANIAAGGRHTLAVKTDGSLWSWGRDGSGALGAGAQTQSLVPLRVGEGFVTVGARVTGSVGVKRDGTVWTWGSASNGLLGDGTTTSRGVPGAVPGLSGVTAIAVAGDKTLALKADGTVWAWGSNRNGQIGDGTFTNRSRPVKVVGLPPVTAIAASGYASFALTVNGSLWAWGGSIYDGVLGDGSNQPSAVPKLIGTGFVKVAGGLRHAVAMKADGTLRSWGWNGSGQLGEGGLASGSIPQPVVNASATAYLSVTGIDVGNALDPLRVLQVVNSSAESLTSSLTDQRASGLQGDVYFSALLPPSSPLLGCGSECPSYRVSTAPQADVDGTPRRGPLNSFRSVRPLAADSSGMVAGVLTRSGFKQTGGTNYVQAEQAYNGDLGRAGTLDVYSGVRNVLAGSNAVICMGVTVPALSGKGQVLMRPIATGSEVQGVVQCPPVQTAATIGRFRAEASGPITARTILSFVNPLDEERGKPQRLFSWAVAPDGRQFMQTGPNVWEPMSEPMRPVATVVMPTSGSYRLEVTRDLDLSGLVGTLVFIGVGENWEDVRNLNKAGHHYTVR
jgi:alpha-tubulin suppressor-like RCC1 family protein